MDYGQVCPGRFLERPNRFIAHVETAEGVQTVHVKNTGRCRELLVPGCRVYLEKSGNLHRKTAYDLIAAEKEGKLINLDAQAPNRVFREWAEQGRFLADAGRIRGEYPYGDSRLDFCIETPGGLHLVEVKGVTLEQGGRTYFPDAPTQRGVRHLQALRQAVRSGLDASVVFVVQLRDAVSTAPNDVTHPDFGRTLRQAAQEGVAVRAYRCQVSPGSISILDEIPVILQEAAAWA